MCAAGDANTSLKEAVVAGRGGNSTSGPPPWFRLLTLVGVFLVLGGLGASSLLVRNAHNKAESVMVSPVSEGYGGVIRNGARYWTNEYYSNGLQLYRRAFKERQPTLVLNLPRDKETVGGMYLTDTDIWILALPSEKQINQVTIEPLNDISGGKYLPGPPETQTYQSPISQAMRGMPPPVRVLSVRVRTEPPVPLTPGQVRLTYPRPIPRDSRPASLYRIPFDGSPAVKTTLDTQGYALSQLRYVLTSEGVFWVRPRAGKSVIIRGKDTVQEEVAVSDDLILSPNDGTGSRVWRSGVYATRLSFRKDTLYLDGFLREYPGMEKTVGVSQSHPATPSDSFPAVYNPVTQEGKSPVSASFSTESPGSIRFLMRDGPDKPLVGSGSIMSQSGVEIDTNLFWMESYLVASSESNQGPNVPKRWRVMTCRSNGSERRILWEMRAKEGVRLTSCELFAHQGRLYVFSEEESEVSPTGEMEMGSGLPPYLIRLNPKNGQPIGKPVALLPQMKFDILTQSDNQGQRLSEGLHLDGGYLYAFVLEPRRVLYDLGAVMGDEKIVRLYRVRLPE